MGLNTESEQTHSSLLQLRSERAIERVLDEAVCRGERWMSVCRILFSLVTFVVIIGGSGSWFWKNGYPSRRGWLISSGGAAFIAFSLWLIRRTKHGALPRRILTLSVAMDAAMCCIALVGNGVWPSRDHGSLDVAALILTIVISGFRLSPPVVAFSLLINATSVILLRHKDLLIIGSTYDLPFSIRLAIYLTSAGSLAMIVAYHTRKLVMAGAHDSLRAQGAQRALGTLLQDHHDVRSMISAANLNAEIMRRGLDENHPQHAHLDHLREDLRAVSDMVSVLRERTLQQLAAIGDEPRVELAAALRAVLPRLALRFPQARIQIEDVAEGLCVLMAGGQTTLQRVLMNVLVNACEGNGTQRAGQIWVRAHRDRDRVSIQIDDDGPGFPETVLRTSPMRTGSSKREGSGLGLFLIEIVVSASEGSLALGVNPSGGARVELLLLSAP